MRPPPGAVIRSVTFASCSDQRQSSFGNALQHAAWDTFRWAGGARGAATGAGSDLFILMGDNIYGQCDVDDLNACPRIQEAYDTLALLPPFQRAPMVGAAARPG